MNQGHGTIRSGEKPALYYQWKRVPHPLGVVLIVHGIGEHIGRYGRLEDWFCGRGFSCYGYDQRGHGRSEGWRTHVSAFSEYVYDLNRITKQVKNDLPELPLFIYAHSMGTVVALLGVSRYPGDYRGVVAASPAVMIGSGTPHWLVQLGGLAARLLPGLRVPSLIEAADLSHDPGIAEAFKRDPLVENTVTLGWLKAMLAAQENVLQGARQINRPTLVLHSRSDRVADIAGTRRLVALLPESLATYHEYDQSYHELHNELEPDRSNTLNDVGAWLNIQLKPQPS